MTKGRSMLSEVRLADLRDATAAELRVLWTQTRDASPPPTLSGRLLRLGLALDLQAARAGGETVADRRSWAGIEARRSAGAAPRSAMSGGWCLAARAPAHACCEAGAARSTR